MVENPSDAKLFATTCTSERRSSRIFHVSPSLLVCHLADCDRCPYPRGDTFHKWLLSRIIFSAFGEDELSSVSTLHVMLAAQALAKYKRWRESFFRQIHRKKLFRASRLLSFNRRSRISLKTPNQSRVASPKTSEK